MPRDFVPDSALKNIPDIRLGRQYLFFRLELSSCLHVFPQCLISTAPLVLSNGSLLPWHRRVLFGERFPGGHLSVIVRMYVSDSCQPAGYFGLLPLQSRQPSVAVWRSLSCFLVQGHLQSGMNTIYALSAASCHPAKSKLNRGYWCRNPSTMDPEKRYCVLPFLKMEWFRRL